MKITAVRENGVFTVAPEGEVNTTTTPELAKAVEDLTGVEELVFDMEKVPFISSACLRVLLSCQRSMNACKGKMRIINANDFVREIFESVGYDRIMSINK